MFRNAWSKIACIPFIVSVMVAAVFFSPALIQQAQAANYPDESEVYFEFEAFGDASKVHVMNFHEYGQRTGWRTVGGVPTYRNEYIKETGIFYNKSDGTLTIDGYDPETRALFGNLNRIFVVSARAADLTVVINDDWESIQSAIRWVPKEQYSHTHGAIIANDSGGKLIVSSSNGSEVHFVSGKNNGNIQSYNPIGIYSKGRVDICGSIDLHITATNKHNGQDYVDADGRGS